MGNSEFILNFIEKQNTSCYKVAQSTGISESTFSKWKVKPTSKVDLSIVQKIAVYFNTTVDSILDCNQPKSCGLFLSDDEFELFKSFNKLSDKDKVKVMERAETLAELAAERAAKKRAAEQPKKLIKIAEPAADELPDDEPEKQEEDEDFYVDLCSLPASAGSGVQLDEGYIEPLRIKPTPIAERANYAVRVSGNSMEPKYSDGDIVLVETCPDIDIGEIGIFIVNDQGYIKKRGENRLISLNPECEDVYFHEGDVVRCRGRVLGKAENV